ARGPEHVIGSSWAADFGGGRLGERPDQPLVATPVADAAARAVAVAAGVGRAEPVPAGLDVRRMEGEERALLIRISGERGAACLAVLTGSRVVQVRIGRPRGPSPAGQCGPDSTH